MGIAKQFNKIIETHLKAHAAWLPITNTYRLGDYGLIAEGVFQKLGNIKDDFNVSFTTGNGPNASLKFVSDRTTVVNASANAEAMVNPQIGIKAGVTYKFQEDKSFLIEAPVIRVSTIENVNQVANQLSAINAWKDKYKVVWQRYEAQDAVVLSTIEGGTEVTVNGTANTPEHFNIGNVTAKVEVETNKALGLDIRGKTGVIALGLFKLKWIGGGTTFMNDINKKGAEAEDLTKVDLSDDI